jgi:hypothetical protein
MDLDLVNRALLHVGQSPISGSDRSSHNAAYQTAKFFYITTFLEALSEVEWTGGRRREKLVETGRPVLSDRRYRFAYDMPFDCAKPIELQGNEYFVIEDRLVFTDAPDAELLYVSDGKILRPLTVFSGGRPGVVYDVEYMTGGRPWTRPDIVLYPGKIANLPSSLEDPPVTDDYPDYKRLDYEPKFYEYIERVLAAKFAMKLSDQQQVRLQLLQEAMLIKQEAVSASKSRLAAKIKPADWWTEEMGE